MRLIVSGWLAMAGYPGQAVLTGGRVSAGGGIDNQGIGRPGQHVPDALLHVDVELPGQILGGVGQRELRGVAEVPVERLSRAPQHHVPQRAEHDERRETDQEHLRSQLRADPCSPRPATFLAHGGSLLALCRLLGVRRRRFPVDSRCGTVDRSGPPTRMASTSLGTSSSVAVPSLRRSRPRVSSPCGRGTDSSLGRMLSNDSSPRTSFRRDGDLDTPVLQHDGSGARRPRGAPATPAPGRGRPPERRCLGGWRLPGRTRVLAERRCDPRERRPRGCAGCRRRGAGPPARTRTPAPAEGDPAQASSQPLSVATVRSGGPGPRAARA